MQVTIRSDNSATPAAARAWHHEIAALFKLAIPLALTHLAQMAIGLTDTIMLGRYDRTALAASVLGNTVYLFCWIIGLGPVGAVSPMIAQVLGARPDDHAQTRAIVRMGLWSAAIVSVPLVGLLLCAGPILLALGQRPELAEAASRFVIPLAFGLPCTLAFQVLRNFVTALGRPQATLYIMAATVLCNLFGDYALIFGHFGAPRLGLVGSGIASALSLAFSLLAMIAVIAATPRFRAFRLAHQFFRSDRERLREIFRLGGPMSAIQILESGFYLLMHLLVGSFGAVTVAAHAIAWNVQTVTSLVAFGIGAATTVRVGLAAGAGDTQKIRRAGYAAFMSIVALMAVVAVPMAVFAPRIAGLYLSDDPSNGAVIAMAVPFLWVAAAYQIVDGLQNIAAMALQGLKDVRAPMWIMAAGFWLVGLPASLALAFFFDMKALGIWLGLAIALVATSAMLCIRFYRLTHSQRASSEGVWSP
jgi:MATE family multidrug resistance protein